MPLTSCRMTLHAVIARRYLGNLAHKPASSLILCDAKAWSICISCGTNNVLCVNASHTLMLCNMTLQTARHTLTR